MEFGKWEVKIKKLLLFLTVTLFAFRLWQTTGCKHFSGFYFNPLSVRINVEEQRNLDKYSSNTVSKIFHNKIASTINQVSFSYAKTLEPRFILEILGPLGLILALISVSKIMANAKSMYSISLLSVLIASFLLIMPIDPKKTFYLTVFAWFAFALPSAGDFAKSRNLTALFLLLLLASFWYFALSWQMPEICNEIFFN